jgi:hypothetical protein
MPARAAPLLIVLLGMLLPSCGFITVLFDNDDGEDDRQYYSVEMNYRYLGGFPILPFQQVHFLFIPLNENYEFEEGSFDQAESRASAVPTGVVSVDLKRGPHSVLGFVDSDMDGQLSMFDPYAFLFRLPLADAFRNPGFFWVDSSIEDNPPYFEMDDMFMMRGVMLLVPKNGETIASQNQNIPLVGITVESRIDNVQVFVDGSPVGLAESVPGDDVWSFPVDMSSKTDGWYNIWVDGYDGPTFIDSSDTVNFYYDAP